MMIRNSELYGRSRFRSFLSRIENGRIIQVEARF